MFVMKENQISIQPYKDLFPQIEESVFLADGARIIGDVILGKNVSVWYNTVIRGDVNHVRIGENTNIQDSSCLHVENGLYPLIIQEGVTIGHSVTLHGCTIEKHCLIGMGAIILNGAIIGEESIIGAGAVIPEGMQVPKRSIVMGIPAKIRREVDEERAKTLRYSAVKYVNYCENYKKIAKQISIENYLPDWKSL